jgi:hypothetical protein
MFHFFRVKKEDTEESNCGAGVQAGRAWVMLGADEDDTRDVDRWIGVRKERKFTSKSEHFVLKIFLFFGIVF